MPLTRRTDVISSAYDEGYMPRCSHAAPLTHRPRPFAPSPRTPPVPARLRTHLIHRPRRRHRSAPASAVLCPAVPPTLPLRTAHLYRTRPRPPSRPNPRPCVHPAKVLNLQTFSFYQSISNFMVSLPNVSEKDVKGLLFRKQPLHTSPNRSKKGDEGMLS